MALKKLSFAILLLFVLAPLLSFAQKNPFEHLPNEERLKIAKKYHDLSMDVYQTSEMHRMYKDTALLAVPDHVEYMQRYSYSYKKSGEHIRAMELLNRAKEIDIKQNKTNALEYSAWSYLYFYRDYENAIADVEHIRKITKIPYSSCHGEPCLFVEGLAYYQLKNYNKAIELFEYMLDYEEKELKFKRQDNFLGYYYLALAYAKINQKEKAIEVFKEQLEAFKNFTEMHYHIAKLYFELNQKELAKTHIETSYQLLQKNVKHIKEPYVERFEEVFPHHIEQAYNEIIK